MRWWSCSATKTEGFRPEETLHPDAKLLRIMNAMNIGIYIYDNAEVLDFAGPFEVFSTAKRLSGADWQIFLVAKDDRLVTGRGNFPVQPHYTIKNHPPIDLLIVVGGVHVDELTKRDVIDWIAKTARTASQVAAVCTGSFLLAEARLLDGLQVTTHWEDLDDLRDQYPQLQVQSARRWLAQGKFVTSGGISAGIDMSLHLVAELLSPALAEKTARQMEYRWQRDSVKRPGR
jgi:transcriptional regulator GlxA family with amidase domain